ncbi:hypothetical protein [Caulobacter sp. FWC2]|uniref:hypothetical protein n=1 Tax=Caulobacter sp. FWC2 TaxID=69664 RepID=UPI0013041958|nr:hypothetical protein [Caulobacter sp. FWC2]
MNSALIDGRLRRSISETKPISQFGLRAWKPKASLHDMFLKLSEGQTVDAIAWMGLL